MSPRRPTTSIVILTRNQLGYTQRCVDAIARRTPEPHELVFVDNGSTDGTLAYLRSIEGALVIDNDRNVGFGGACNQGIASSTGERILLLNNDVVPTHGWLAALHDALDESADTGLAGPRTNRIAGPQQVDEVGYDEESLAGLGEWAQDWCDSHRGIRTPLPRLVGFCILLERAVVERIGGFDLRYAVGNFEDDDLCLRAAVAGFRGVVAEDSFIHHFGSRTFVGEGLDHTAHMAENYRRFAAAWQLGDAATATGYSPAAAIESSQFEPERHHAPLVAVDSSSERIELGDVRSRIVAVCCDRWDPTGTRAALDEALATWGPVDDVTVLVRIDPRDRESVRLLESVADARESEGLPDLVVVQAPELDDRIVLRRVDEVVVAGRTAWSRALLARRLGVEVRTVGT
jgi:GT2 family glycosyltransferase